MHRRDRARATPGPCATISVTSECAGALAGASTARRVLCRRSSHVPALRRFRSARLTCGDRSLVAHRIAFAWPRRRVRCGARVAERRLGDGRDSTVMVVAQKSGLLGKMPPQKVTEHFLGVLGVRYPTPKPARRAIATLSHFAFGALFGLRKEVSHVRGAPRGSSPVDRRWRRVRHGDRGGQLCGLGVRARHHAAAAQRPSGPPAVDAPRALGLRRNAGEARRLRPADRVLTLNQCSVTDRCVDLLVVQLKAAIRRLLDTKGVRGRVLDKVNRYGEVVIGVILERPAPPIHPPPSADPDNPDDKTT